MVFSGILDVEFVFISYMFVHAYFNGEFHGVKDWFLLCVVVQVSTCLIYFYFFS